MVDVFVSYDSGDRDRVRSLVQLFEQQGWSVWWDRKIPAGKTFAEVIGDAVESASCIVVCWSEESVKSKWVKREAAEGDRRGVLVPVLLDDVTIPFQFREIHAARLVGLPEVRDHSEIDHCLRSISSLIGKSLIAPPAQAKGTSEPPALPEPEKPRPETESVPSMRPSASGEPSTSGNLAPPISHGPIHGNVSYAGL